MTVLELMEVLINYCPDTKVEVVITGELNRPDVKYAPEDDTIYISKYVKDSE
jgi:hypothetical protein